MRHPEYEYYPNYRSIVIENYLVFEAIPKSDILELPHLETDMLLIRDGDRLKAQVPSLAAAGDR
jgi:hypothetical protein